MFTHQKELVGPQFHDLVGETIGERIEYADIERAPQGKVGDRQRDRVAAADDVPGNLRAIEVRSRHDNGARGSRGQECRPHRTEIDDLVAGDTRRLAGQKRDADARYLVGVAEAEVADDVTLDLERRDEIEPDAERGLQRADQRFVVSGTSPRSWLLAMLRCWAESAP